MTQSIGIHLKRKIRVVKKQKQPNVISAQVRTTSLIVHSELEQLRSLWLSAAGPRARGAPEPAGSGPLQGGRSHSAGISTGQDSITRSLTEMRSLTQADAEV